MSLCGHRRSIKSAVLVSVKGALAPLGGTAALDPSCAPRGAGSCDGRRVYLPGLAERACLATWPAFLARPR